MNFSYYCLACSHGTRRRRQILQARMFFFIFASIQYSDTASIINIDVTRPSGGTANSHVNRCCAWFAANANLMNLYHRIIGSFRRRHCHHHHHQPVAGGPTAQQKLIQQRKTVYSALEMATADVAIEPATCRALRSPSAVNTAAARRRPS